MFEGFKKVGKLGREGVVQVSKVKKKKRRCNPRKPDAVCFQRHTLPEMNCEVGRV
jgi:hypothetical protein